MSSSRLIRKNNPKQCYSEEKYLLGLAIQMWMLFNAICWFYSRNVVPSGLTSRESTGFIDLGASTVKGILGPFADRMRNLSPEKLPHESLYELRLVYIAGFRFGLGFLYYVKFFHWFRFGLWSPDWNIVKLGQRSVPKTGTITIQARDPNPSSSPCSGKTYA